MCHICCGAFRNQHAEFLQPASVWPIEYHRQEDGRWLADIAALPGVTAYGQTRRQATAAVQALALRLIADRLHPWPNLLLRS